MDTTGTERFYTFHETVRGQLHVKRQIPCEDFSGSFSSPDGRCHIAVTADGHGAEECFRSARGSRFAVEETMRLLQQLAQTTLDSDESERLYYAQILHRPGTALRQLTDSIVAAWHDRVMADYQECPPSADELEPYADAYADGKNIPHIYGTTLIAALKLPQALLLIQQGDGRCDVFFRDGHVEQPIPWDSRCQDNTTTSMCDEDVANSIRSCVIDLQKQPVLACYLGSDGVEDAYPDTYVSRGICHDIMGGVHTFYRDLTCRLAENLEELQGFRDYLKDFLPRFSEEGLYSPAGSGDDVTVSGIVDLTAVADACLEFAPKIQGYQLENELFLLQDKLLSKTRKHEILQKRAEEAADREDRARQDLALTAQQLARLRKEQEKAEADYAQAQAALEEFRQDTDQASRECEEQYGPTCRILKLINMSLREAEERISGALSSRENCCRSLEKRVQQLTRSLEETEHRLELQKEEAEAASGSCREAGENYQAYHADFQALEDRIRRMEEQVSKLSDPGEKPLEENFRDRAEDYPLCYECLDMSAYMYQSFGDDLDGSGSGSCEMHPAPDDLWDMDAN